MGFSVPKPDCYFEAVGGAKNKQRRLHRVEEIQAIGIRKLPVDSRATDTGC
jgi:hypothetical protein